MSDDIKKNVSDINIWKRALFMLLFAILYALAEVVVWAVVIFQFLIVLVTGSKNERLLDFGQNLTTYIYEIVRFQTFNTERQPFPFDDWPDGPPEDDDDEDDDDDDDGDDEDDDGDDGDDDEPPSPGPSASAAAAAAEQVETIELGSDDDAPGEDSTEASTGEDEEQEDEKPSGP